MKDLTIVFKALSDETRLRILKLLEHGELCVCDIVAACGMTQPSISFHLRVLKSAGFVTDRKQGKWMHYKLDESDLFRRHLLMSVMEKMPQAGAKADMVRLNKFLKTKNQETATCECGTPIIKARRKEAL
jgi:ArsR family transcriptional regulator, arsenate/arsenite/antimonite-responsive transcriptional repressor